MTIFDKPLANPVVVLREEFDDWAILFHPETAAAVGINPVGVVIWKLLDGMTSCEAIVSAIQARFADVPGTVSQEVSAFIADLANRGFVGYEVRAA